MTHPFAGRRILLGVTGGIACYKAVPLARLLAQAGAEVDVILTRSAREFIGAVTFEAVTGRAVHTELHAAGHALDHIRLPRAAELVVVAPATADFLARAAHGRADDLLSAALLANVAPALLVPAMNDRMWAHPQTGNNVRHLREIGYHVLEPAEGPLAVGEGSGPGRMPEPEEIVAHSARLLDRPTLRGLRVLVTAGPTREAIDPVRYISNHSSGKMGVAVAAAAWSRGAEVALVHGPMTAAVPVGVRAVATTTTEEMCDAVRAEIGAADVVVMAAAPADFTAAAPAAQKIKKGAAPAAVEIAPTIDILRATADRRKPGATIVGFALETTDVLASARAKLESKQLDIVVANDATEPGAGFGVDTNRVTLVLRSGTDEQLSLMSKADVAAAILDQVERLRDGR
jgi:phosphopantothenoylcysteine decarboxylase/phosphopantothenate--cysteine ligase